MTYGRQLAPLAATFAVIVGCSSSAERLRPLVDDDGKISIAVVATAGNGTRYRLSGANVHLMSATSSFTFDQDLTTDSESVTLNMPPGLYNTTLSWGGTLDELAADGTVTKVVSATLTTPMPVALTVVANQTVSLVFAFTIPIIGTVTFAHGAVGITITTQFGDPAGYAFNTYTTTTASNTAFSGPHENALMAVLPNIGTPLEFGIVGVLTGEWYLQQAAQFQGYSINATVCARFAQPGGLGSQEMQDLLLDAFDPATAELCVEDNGASVNSRLIITMRSSDAPTTATFSNLTSDPLGFYVEVIAELTSRPFDYSAGTLDLTQLATMGSNLQVAQHQIGVGSSSASWYQTSSASAVPEQMWYSFTAL